MGAARAASSRKRSAARARRRGERRRCSIRRLKLSGFKSFVEPAELRIEPGLTGVVGPNGCGKSNLLEAIRWVMGEGSPKSLRGGGMDDVIFAGTATPPAARLRRSVAAGRARSGDERRRRGRESEVTRRIERGAGSAYRIDGRDVRAKDVALLFADAATGAHTPALVSQGRIGAVIAAKPTERRLMLEEAAGIAGLHARRKDAEQKLRATEANLARLDELLGDQEARAAALRRQARAAERYRALSDQIRARRGAAALRRWAEADRRRARRARKPRRRRARSRGCSGRWPTRRRSQEQAAELLAERREAAAEARDAGHGRWRTSWRRRGRGATRWCGGWPSSTGSTLSLAAETAREEALRDDAARAIAALDEERSAIDARLADAEAIRRRGSRPS